MPLIDVCQSVIFDCDGVILASNQVKSEAFAQALPDEASELVKEFVNYHKENGGISRYVKFEHYFKNIKKQAEYSDDLDLALNRYSVYSRNGLMQCEEIPGICSVLEFLNTRQIPCFVVSGGDQKEVQSVFKERNLGKFFQDILGSPLSKKENLSVLKSRNLLKKPGIFFGDARSDMIAAEAFDLDFIFVAGVSEWGEGRTTCREKQISTIEDFEGFIDGIGS
jgi:phosphoglycolate phosphatase-like HAD superfamily hydrolase